MSVTCGVSYLVLWENFPWALIVVASGVRSAQGGELTIYYQVVNKESDDPE